MLEPQSLFLHSLLQLKSLSTHSLQFPPGNSWSQSQHLAHLIYPRVLLGTQHSPQRPTSWKNGGDGGRMCSPGHPNQTWAHGTTHSKRFLGNEGGETGIPDSGEQRIITSEITVTKLSDFLKPKFHCY